MLRGGEVEGASRGGEMNGRRGRGWGQGVGGVGRD